MNNPFVRPEITCGLRAGHDPLCHIQPIQRELRTGPPGVRREHYLAASISWLVGATLVFVAFASNANDMIHAAPAEAPSLMTAATNTVEHAPVAIMATVQEPEEPSTGLAVHMGLAVASDMLDASRGGTEVQLSDIRVQGSLRDASASELQTGSNLITTGAFANTVGFPMTIQNSGNNVLIQNATIINVTSY